MIITFDIHGVLFTPDYKKIFLLLVRNLKALQLCMYAAHPRFIKNMVRLLKKKAVPEEYIEFLTQSFKRFKPYKNLALELANAQKPNYAVFEIVKKLKAQGHTLHIFSNIGGTILQHLSEKHPELLSHFDTFFVPTQENGYLSKPNPLAFDHYVQNHNPENKYLIFIDNRRHNVHISRHYGIHGIHFKSVPLLEQALSHLYLH